MPVYSRVQPKPPAVIRVRLPPRRGFSPFKLLLLLGFCGMFALACLFFGSVLSYYSYYQYSGRIVPGVSVGSIQLDGMTPEEAILTLQQNWELQARIQVTNGIQSQTLTLADLGISVDVP